MLLVSGCEGADRPFEGDLVGYLQKPYRANALLDAVRVALE